MLSFSQLAQANRQRCEQIWHPLAEWSPQDWTICLAGEVGEVCHIVKELRRWGDFDHPPSENGQRQFQAALADELAGVVLYADLLAQRLGLDLGAAVAAKFNATSRKVGSDVLLPSVEG